MTTSTDVSAVPPAPENSGKALIKVDPAAHSILAPTALPPSLSPLPVKPKPIVASPARTPVKPPQDPLSRFRNQHKAEDDEARMGFIDHLMELRKRMWYAIIAVLVCVVVALVFYNQVFDFLIAPIHKINQDYLGAKGDPLRLKGWLKPGQVPIEITSTEPLSTMIMIMWLGFWAGILLSSPFVLYQIWAFVAPGLRAEEKRAVRPVLYGGPLFFLTGAAIAYYLLAPVTFDFFVWFDLSLGIKVLYTSEKVIELLLTMMVVSGFLCEIPLIVAGLSKLEILEPWMLLRYWKVLTFSSVVLGAIVAPGNDIMSLSVFSGLILGIYVVSIVMSFMFAPRKKNDKKKDDKKGTKKQPA